MPPRRNDEHRPPSTEFVIATVVHRPLWGQAAALWNEFLVKLVENQYPNRLRKEQLLRDKFPYQDSASGDGYAKNNAAMAIAQYLSAYKFKSVSADRLDNVARDSKNMLAKIKTLQDEVSKIGASLSYSHRTDAGEDTYGNVYFATSYARDAQISIANMVEQLEQAASRPARSKSGVDAALRASPEEAFAENLGKLWAAAGLSTSGGESGDGIDDVLAYVIEAVDERRQRMSSRKKWLDEGLMKIARDAGQALRDGQASADY